MFSCVIKDRQISEKVVNITAEIFCRMLLGRVVHMLMWLLIYIVLKNTLIYLPSKVQEAGEWQNQRCALCISWIHIYLYFYFKLSGSYFSCNLAVKTSKEEALFAMLGNFNKHTCTECAILGLKLHFGCKSEGSDDYSRLSTAWANTWECLMVKSLGIGCLMVISEFGGSELDVIWPQWIIFSLWPKICLGQESNPSECSNGKAWSRNWLVNNVIVDDLRPLYKGIGQPYAWICNFVYCFWFKSNFCKL